MKETAVKNKMTKKTQKKKRDGQKTREKVYNVTITYYF